MLMMLKSAFRSLPKLTNCEVLLWLNATRFALPVTAGHSRPLLAIRSPLISRPCLIVAAGDFEMSKARYYRKSLSKRLSSSARDSYYSRWRKSLKSSHEKNLRRFAK